MTPARPPLVLALVVALPLLAGGALVGLAVWGWIADVTWAAWLGTTLAVLFALAVVAGARAPRPSPEGVPLTREAQPALWREVDDLADRLGAVRPTTLHLVAATDATSLRTGRGWDLALGLPLLARLTAGELRVVLSHALALHRTAREPGVAALLAVDERVQSSYDHLRAPLSWVLWPWRWAHAAAMGFVERELGDEADRLAAAVTSPSTAATALRRSIEIEVAWGVVLDEYAALFTSSRRRASLTEALARVEEAGRADLAAVAAESLRAERPGWLDSSSTTADRIAALAELPDQGPPGDGRPALALWTGGQESLAAAEGELLVEPLPVVGWDELVGEGVPLATRQAMVGAAVAIAEQASGRVMTPASYAWLFAELTRPDGGAVRDLLAATGEEPGDDDPAGFLSSLVACGLFETGAEARLRWDGPAAIVDHDGRTIDLAALTADAVGSPTRIGVLTELLERRGLDLGRTPGEDVPPPLPEVLAVATLLVVDGAGRYDAFFWTSGLLLVPTATTMGGSLLGEQAAPRQAERVDAVLRRPLAELQASPGVRWVPAESMRRWQARLLPRVAIHLDTDDGRLELRPSEESQGDTDIPDALALMVGPPTRRSDWEAS